jgi:hypothetical protein
VLTGHGIMKTKPFTLAAGNYTVEWTAKDTDGFGCYHGGFFQPVDKGELLFETLGNEMVAANKTATGSTEIYNLKGGQYYLDMSSGCAWTVTIKPQQ